MMGFRDKGFPEDVLRLADETFKELLIIDIEELSIMPINKFVEMVQKENFSATHLDILAQLAHETANAYSLENNEEAANSFYSKTLQLYYLLNQKDRTFSFEREQIIAKLENRL